MQSHYQRALPIWRKCFNIFYLCFSPLFLSHHLPLPYPLTLCCEPAVGGRGVWPGDELHHPGSREHWLYGGAAGTLWCHLPGWDLEHVHSHPAEECPQPSDQHRGGPDPERAAQDELCERHDCRYGGRLVLGNIRPMSATATLSFSIPFVLFSVHQWRMLCNSHVVWVSRFFKKLKGNVSHCNVFSLVFFSLAFMHQNSNIWAFVL